MTPSGKTPDLAACPQKPTLETSDGRNGKLCFILVAGNMGNGELIQETNSEDSALTMFLKGESFGEG